MRLQAGSSIAVFLGVAIIGCGGGADPKSDTCKDFKNGGGKDRAMAKAVAGETHVPVGAANDAITSACNGESGGKPNDKPFQKVVSEINARKRTTPSGKTTYIDPRKIAEGQYGHYAHYSLQSCLDDPTETTQHCHQEWPTG
jgi:hypothetical protein